MTTGCMSAARHVTFTRYVVSLSYVRCLPLLRNMLNPIDNVTVYNKHNVGRITTQ